VSGAQEAFPGAALPPNRGEHVARLICSACHEVAANQEFPPILEPPAPRFADIAKKPGVTAASLEHFVTSTHWDMKTMPMRMPNVSLSDEDAAAVAKYILSLKNPKKTPNSR
jgi:mono/diheme cytochrome c family protein